MEYRIKENKKGEDSIYLQSTFENKKDAKILLKKLTKEFGSPKRSYSIAYGESKDNGTDFLELKESKDK